MIAEPATLLLGTAGAARSVHRRQTAGSPQCSCGPVRTKRGLVLGTADDGYSRVGWMNLPTMFVTGTPTSDA